MRHSATTRARQCGPSSSARRYRRSPPRHHTKENGSEEPSTGVIRATSSADPPRRLRRDERGVTGVGASVVGGTWPTDAPLTYQPSVRDTLAQRPSWVVVDRECGTPSRPRFRMLSCSTDRVNWLPIVRGCCRRDHVIVVVHDLMRRPAVLRAAGMASVVAGFTLARAPAIASCPSAQLHELITVATVKRPLPVAGSGGSDDFQCREAPAGCACVRMTLRTRLGERGARRGPMSSTSPDGVVWMASGGLDPP